VFIICALIVIIVVYNIRVNNSHIANSVVNATYKLNSAFSEPKNNVTVVLADGSAIVTIDPLVKWVYEKQQEARQRVIATNLVDRVPELVTDLH
jgi:hypothetical protein